MLNKFSFGPSQENEGRKKTLPGIQGSCLTKNRACPTHTEPLHFYLRFAPVYITPEFTLSLSPRAAHLTRSRGILAHLTFCRGDSCLRNCSMLMLASGRNAIQLPALIYVPIRHLMPSSGSKSYKRNLSPQAVSGVQPQ